MRSAGRMDGQRTRVADVGDVIEELERADKARTCLAALLEFESDETTVALEIDVGAAALLGILVHAGVNDARNFGMTLQIERDFRSIAAMFAHPKRQRFQPLDKLEGIEGAHGRADVAKQD